MNTKVLREVNVVLKYVALAGVFLVLGIGLGYYLLVIYPKLQYKPGPYLGSDVSVQCYGEKVITIDQSKRGACSTYQVSCEGGYKIPSKWRAGAYPCACEGTAGVTINNRCMIPADSQ